MRPSSTEHETEQNASFRGLPNEISPRERPTDTETAPVAPQTSEQLLVRDVIGRNPVHVEKKLTELVLERFTANKKGLDNPLSTDSETLLLHTVRKIENSSEFIRHFLDFVNDNPSFIKSVTGLVRYEQRNRAAEKNMIDDSCR